MDLPAADRRLAREDADLRHQIVTDLALDGEGRVEVDLLTVRAQVVEFGGGDEAGAALGVGERDPHGAPQLAPFPFREELAQRGSAIAP